MLRSPSLTLYCLKQHGNKKRMTYSSEVAAECRYKSTLLHKSHWVDCGHSITPSWKLEMFQETHEKFHPSSSFSQKAACLNREASERCLLNNSRLEWPNILLIAELCKLCRTFSSSLGLYCSNHRQNISAWCWKYGIQSSQFSQDVREGRWSLRWDQWCRAVLFWSTSPPWTSLLSGADSAFSLHHFSSTAVSLSALFPFLVFEQCILFPHFLLLPLLKRCVPASSRRGLSLLRPLSLLKAPPATYCSCARFH